MPRHFVWQAWHLVTSMCVSRGKRGTISQYLTSTFVLRGRRGTISHPPSFCVAGVAQSHTHLCHTPSVTYHLCHTPSVSKCYYTPSFIQSLSTILSRTSLSHTILLPPASHSSASFTHTSSHTIFHTQLCRTPSVTYYLSQLALAQANSCFVCHVCRYVYLAVSPACFGMFAFLACLAQAKATGAENRLDIKLFIFRLPACLPRHVLCSGTFLSSACFGMFAFLACLAQACLPSCVSSLFWHVCFSGLFSSSMFT